MKKLIYCISILCAFLFIFSSFRNFQETGAVSGTVTPATGARLVWVVSATDTLKAVVSKGNFTIPHVKTGTYKLIVTAVAPYKDFAKDGIQVTKGQTTDVGEIKLSK